MKEVLTFNNTCRYEDDAECTDQYLFLPSGTYLLEVWGASGGYNKLENVAKGGYSSGILSLSERTKIYIYVGAEGEKITGKHVYSKNPFNGGGFCHSGNLDTSVCSSGGGSTDIRIGSNSIHHRVIVAGGGGGGAYSISCSNETPGGAAGGITGESGQKVCDGTGGKGGGISTKYFFNGGNANLSDGCGGGGGFYGGEEGFSFINGGGGGSGFVFTKDNYNDSLSSGITLNQKYFLKNSTILGGRDLIPSYERTYPIEGNFGNGFARVSILAINTGNNFAKQKITRCLNLFLIRFFTNQS